MASTSQSEGSPLLGKRPSTARPQYGENQSHHSTSQKQKHRRFDSSASSRVEEQNEEDTHSTFSHVSLDVTPTYYRLLGCHVLSLLPGFAFQLATIMLAFHAPCHIHCESDNRHSDRKLCRHLLGDWMSITAFVLGLLSWIAAYSFRPALLKIVEWTSLPFQSLQIISTSFRPFSGIITSLVFVLLRITVLECIRMFNIIVINAVLFAGLAHLQGQEKAQDTSSAQFEVHWLLHWYDPRFTVGLWVAIGWCFTEFVVSSFQMFDRLSLYRCLFEERPIEAEENDIPAATDYIPATSSFINDTHSPSGDYTSDSAATVRAFSKTTTVPAAAPNGQHILVNRLKGNAPQGEEESAFSMVNEVDEQEMYRLKDKLDEEVDILLQARMRDELQQTLGQPLTEVPIILCALWRIDGWLWNLSSTLLMSASVALAQGEVTDSPRLFPPFHLIKTTLFVLIALHSLFTFIWTVGVGYLSFALVTYTSMLAGLGLCISALGRWGLLV